MAWCLLNTGTDLALVGSQSRFWRVGELFSVQNSGFIRVFELQC